MTELNDFRERLDGPADRDSHLLEFVQEGANPSDVGFVERYLKRELHWLVRCAVKGFEEEYIASFERAHLVRDEKASVVHSLNLLAEHGIRSRNLFQSIRTRHYTGIGAEQRRQEAVLLNPVECGDLPEDLALSSLVWLDLADRFQKRWLNEGLYRSAESGWKILGRAGNRECDVLKFAPVRGHAPFAADECREVERGLKVGECIAGDQHRTVRHFRLTDQDVSTLLSLRVILMRDKVVYGFPKGGLDGSFNLSLEIRDVMLGPFQFGAGAVQPAAWWHHPISEVVLLATSDDDMKKADGL